MPAICAWCNGQPRTNCAKSQTTPKGTVKERTPMSKLTRRFALSDRGSISAPARKVRTPLPSMARKLIHSLFAWRWRKFPARTPTRISISATDIPAQIEIRLAASARPIQIAATNQMFCRTTLVSPEPAKILVSIIKLLLRIGAPTGVISSEYSQAVFPLRKGKLHCQPLP